MDNKLSQAHKDHKYIEAIRLYNNADTNTVEYYLNEKLVQEMCRLLYKNCKQNIVFYCTKSGKNEAEAEDFFQEALIAFVYGEGIKDDFVLTVPIGGFFYIFAIRMFLKQNRGKKAVFVPYEENIGEYSEEIMEMMEEVIQNYLQEKDLQEILSQNINYLPKDDQTIIGIIFDTIKLKEGELWKLAEELEIVPANKISFYELASRASNILIAKQFGITINAAKARKSRAIERLRIIIIDDIGGTAFYLLLNHASLVMTIFFFISFFNS